MFINAFLELFGLSLIIPIIGLLGNSERAYFITSYLSEILVLEKNEIFLPLIIFFITFQILKTSFTIWYTWYENNYLYNFKERVSSKLLKTYLSQNFSFFTLNNSSKLLRNITYSTDMCSVYLFQFLKISLDLILLSSIFIFLVFYNFKVTIIIVTLLVILSIIYSFTLRDKLKDYGLKRQHHVNKRLQYFQESLDNIKYIKISSKEDFFFKKFKFENQNLANSSIPAEFLKNLPKPIIEIIAILFISFFLFYFYNLQAINTIEIFEILGLYLAAAFRLIPSFSRILTGFQSLKNSYPEIENISNELKRGIIFEKQSANKTFLKDHLTIDIKKFSYKDHEKDFHLSNIFLKINKGEKIGIIGESGSGKSTLLDLIIGLIKPQEGTIKCDEKSIFSDIKGWQNKIGYVPQKITIFEDTLENNILFGRDQNDALKKKAKELVKKTNLKNLIKADSDTLSAFISEKGKNISGGEMQRVAICRALLNDPDILILDEATSSLDPRTEDQIITMINSLYTKTVIFVSHRMNTLKFCDKILKVFDGKLETISINKD